ncbi:polysaccharide biosynthesis protein [Lactococcus cremoris]|uniref:SGNH/GDSL hydrolase family protein n=1 Tax=Lactococcus lactis subsp. cremoris TaxID=1359 RepID=UPI002FC66502
MMKKGIFVITIVISIALIIGGFYSYNSRINNLSKADKGKEVVKNSSEKNQIDLTYKKYYKNLPKSVQNKIDDISSKNKEVTLTCIWQSDSVISEQFQQNLQKYYGNKFWNIKNITYNGETSEQLLAEKVQNQVLATNPDVVLYEAPLFNDNQNIEATASWTSNEQLITNLASTGAEVIVQPSPPIYGGVVYPVQEEQFKQSLSTKYPYIDYWASYPDKNSDDGVYRTLNASGNKVWLDYITKYFTAN